MLVVITQMDYINPSNLFCLEMVCFNRGGNFHLKVGRAKSSGNGGDPMLGVALIP